MNTKHGCNTGRISLGSRKAACRKPVQTGLHVHCSAERKQTKNGRPSPQQQPTLTRPAVSKRSSSKVRFRTDDEAPDVERARLMQLLLGPEDSYTQLGHGSGFPSPYTYTNSSRLPQPPREGVPQGGAPPAGAAASRFSPLGRARPISPSTLRVLLVDRGLQASALMGEGALLAELDACLEAQAWDLLVESASIGAPLEGRKLPDAVPQAAARAGYSLLPRRPATFDEVQDIHKFDLVLVLHDADLLMLRKEVAVMLGKGSESPLVNRIQSLARFLPHGDALDGLLPHVASFGNARQGEASGCQPSPLDLEARGIRQACRGLVTFLASLHKATGGCRHVPLKYSLAVGLSCPLQGSVLQTPSRELQEGPEVARRDFGGEATKHDEPSLWRTPGLETRACAQTCTCAPQPQRAAGCG
eukprot:jgi/Botrbrau1/3762/Bobra.0363s0039.1